MGGNPKQRGDKTITDFLAIPEGERFHELIAGDIIEKASPSPAHGRAQGRFLSRIGSPFDRPPGGRFPGGWWFATEVEVRFGKEICRPDVVGWRRDRVPQFPADTPTDVLPQWTCEVLSTNKPNDTIRKKHIYHRHLVEHYWILDPDQGALFVYRRHAEGYLEVLAAQRGQRVRAEPFAAIEISVGELFGDDDDEDLADR